MKLVIACMAWVLLILLQTSDIQAQQDHTDDIQIDRELYPNYALFMKIRQAWEAGDYHNLQPLLGKGVTLHLGQVRGHYPKENTVGILKAYFAERESLKVAYDIKKMTETRAVAAYEYRIKETGILCKRLLYFYINKGANGESSLWFISIINEI